MQLYSIRTLLCGMLLCSSSVVARVHAQDVYVGPVAGASLLEHRDDSQTHGRLIHDVTVGRTALAGAMLDVGFTMRDHLALEFLIGPYENDRERSCIYTVPMSCTPQVVSWGIHYGMQYFHTFDDTRWRPYVGGGFGVKLYRFERFGFGSVPDASPTISGTVGVQRQGRHLVRLEVRSLLVQDNPLLDDKKQFELQARVAWLFGLRR